MHQVAEIIGEGRWNYWYREGGEKKKKSRENWMQIEDRNPIIRINEILILISRRDEYTNLYYIFDYIALETRGYEILRILKSIPGAINRFSSRNRIINAPRRSVVIIYMEKKERKKRCRSIGDNSRLADE